MYPSNHFIPMIGRAHDGTNVNDRELLMISLIEDRTLGARVL